MTARLRLSDLPPHVRGTLRAAKKAAAVKLPKAEIPQIVPTHSADSFRVAIPLPPPTNSLYPTQGKRRIKSERYREWIDAAGWQVRVAKLPRVEGRYSFAMYVPEGDKADCDSRIKAAIDLFVRLGLTDDDRFCCSVLVERSWAVPAKEALVVVKSVAEVKP